MGEDYLGHVVCPPADNQHCLDEMNARMLLFHPALSRETHQNKDLRDACHEKLMSCKSLSETIRHLMEIEDLNHH